MTHELEQLAWLLVVLGAAFALVFGRMWLLGKDAEAQAKGLVDAERRAYEERANALAVECPLCWAPMHSLCRGPEGYDLATPHAARRMAGRAA